MGEQVPSSAWLSVSPLPPFGGADAVAERLVLLAHFGADWSVWGPRRVTYWDAFTDRVKAGTFAGPTLADWWESLVVSLGVEPRNPDERTEVSALLAGGDDRAVLAALRTHAAVLVLRARVVAEHWRAHTNGGAIDE